MTGPDPRWRDYALARGDDRVRAFWAAHLAERQRAVERGMVAADLAERVLETMTPDDRAVLMMMDGEEASVKEVAAATGWSESNVKVKAMRARKRMREAVEKLVSSLMMKARVAETFEPSPFFQTRVLAQLRERRAAEEGWTLARLWKTAGLLVSSMAATVAALAVLTFVAPREATAQGTAASGPYTAESVILDESDEQMTNDQLFTSLYESDEEPAR